ncbi:MAG: hypothetical protein WC497_06150 [Patescibacteria group bacterium]
MNKKTAPRVIGYGLLLFIITMVLLFVMSVITGSDQPLDKWWVSVVMAIIMMAVSLWFSRTLRPGTVSQALLYGGVWAIMIAGLLLAIAIPNDTTSIVFGQWPTYLVFIGVAVGPVLLKPKAIPPVVGETQNKV